MLMSLMPIDAPLSSSSAQPTPFELFRANLGGGANQIPFSSSRDSRWESGGSLCFLQLEALLRTY